MSTALNLNGLLPHSARRDPVRPGPRVRVEVEAYGYGTCIKGHGRGLKRGKNIVTIHSDDLSLLEDMVETKTDLVEQAKQSHAELIKIHVETTSKRPLTKDAEAAIKTWCVKDNQDRDPIDLAALEDVQKK